MATGVQDFDALPLLGAVVRIEASRDGVALTSALHPSGPSLSEDADISPNSLTTMEVDLPESASWQVLYERSQAERAVLLAGVNELRLELDHWKRLAQESQPPEAVDAATPHGKARDTIENLLTGKLRGKIVDEVASAANRAKQDEAVARKLR
jgi:hypothetical protein